MRRQALIDDARLLADQPRMGSVTSLPCSYRRGRSKKGCSVFVDTGFRPYSDQWAFLVAIRPMDAHDMKPTILRMQAR